MKNLIIKFSKYFLLLLITTHSGCTHQHLDQHKHQSPILTSHLVANTNLETESLPSESYKGSSIVNAYQVFSIAEEYKILKQLGEEAKMQILLQVNGEFYDAIQTEERVIYFKLMWDIKRTTTL